MARIRTIKPDFWTDSFIVSIPHLARLLYIALWNVADDHGYIKDEIERIAMEVLPREDVNDVDAMLQLLIAAGRVETYVSDGEEVYLKIAKWEDHQRVDRPSKSKIAREPSRKLAIRFETRKKVAVKYGCEPGEKAEACCFYCGSVGRVHWFRHYNGKPSNWVYFESLELDHIEAESLGGDGTDGNIVLACRHCNRSKGTKHWYDALCRQNPHFLASPREPSCTERKGKEVKNIVHLSDARQADFEKFWDAFGYKKGRQPAWESWKKITGYSPELVERIIQSAQNEAERRPALLAKGRTPKMAQGWLTDKRWEDEEEEQAAWKII